MHRKITYYIFCLIGAIIAFNVASISAIIPSVARDLSQPEFVTGKIIWAYMIPYGLCALLYGPLSRKFAIKNILMVCLLLFSFFSFLSASAQSLSSLFIYRLCAGAFASAMTPLTLLYIAHRFDTQKRGKAVGAFFSVTFIASLCGLFLSGVLHWRLVFFIPAVAGTISVAIIAWIFPRFAFEIEGHASRYRQAFRQKAIVRVFLYIFVVSLLYHSARQWMGVYFDVRHHLSQFVISALLTLESFAGIFGEFFGGVIADARGRVFALALGSILMGIALVLLLTANFIIVLGFLMLVWGLGWTINHSGTSTYLTDLPRVYQQEIASLNSSVRFLAGGVGAAVGGIVMQKSFSAAFFVIALLFLAVSISSKAILKT